MTDPSTLRPTRRAFLQLAAAAPLAAMGCATLGRGAAGPSHPGAAPDPLEAVRAVPLPSSAEPALVFRAAGGRGRCG